MASYKFIKVRSKQYKPTKFPDPVVGPYNVLVVEFADTVTGKSITFNAWDIDRPGGYKGNPNNFLQKLIKEGFNGQRNITKLVVNNANPVPSLNGSGTEVLSLNRYSTIDV